MNRELIVNVNPTEISIALCEDKVLVELNKEQCQTGFSVGDIYLGKVRKIMPGLNAAFVNIGHEKDAFIHYLDLGSQFPSLQKLVASQQPGKRGMRVEGIKKSTPPAQLMSEMNRANTIIRDSLNGSFSQIAVDDEAMYNDIRNYIRLIEPEKEKIVKLYRGNVPIFDNFDISKQIKSLFAKYVSLRRGAYLIIEHTEAMNVIDVNSGNRTKAEDNQEQTAMDVNLAAAKEIARQLRLRDLGGIVIIDFIDLHKAQNKQALFDEMVKLMSTDKAKHTVLPLTKFGLMQITRQRVRPVAVEEVSDVCPTCNGTGKIEPTVLLDKKIENQISFLTQDRGHKYIKLVVSPYVAAFLRKGIWSLRRRWEWKYKLRLHVVEDQSLGIVEVHYHDDKDNDLINK